MAWHRSLGPFGSAMPDGDFWSDLLHSLHGIWHVSLTMEAVDPQFDVSIDCVPRNYTLEQPSSYSARTQRIYTTLRHTDSQTCRRS